MKKGLSSDKEYIFIFEDDFVWELKYEEVKNNLDSIFLYDFNVVLLTYHFPVVKPKRLSDKNLLTDDFFENIISYVIQSKKQVSDIINIVKTKFEVDDVTPINLAINIELEQKEFEKNMNIIFAKNKNAKLFYDLLDTFHSKHYHKTYNIS